MKRVLALILCLLPFAVHAEVVALRSGEHADFSRLVMQFGGQPDWEIGRVVQGYELRVAADDIQFDTREVFDRISRKRITGFEMPKDGRLVVQVSSGHHLDAFEIRAGRIVLDIKDGPAPSNSIFEAAFEGPSDIPANVANTAEPMAQEQSNLAMFEQSANSILSEPKEEPQPATNRASGQEALPFPMFNMPLGEGIQAPLPLEIPAERSARVVQMEAALIEQLSRAASQGLIVADIDDPQAAIQEIIAPQSKPVKATDLPADPPPGDLSHVRIKTRVDLDARETIGKPTLTSDGETCLPASKFDIARWGPQIAPQLDFAAYRGALIGEFDTAEPNEIRDLARYYIFLGFGAEAKSTLREFGVIVQDADLLSAMAEIMDQGQADSLGRLAGQFACNTPAALWSVLAASRIEKGDEINRVAIMQAFSALPLHLRRHLGPVLSDRFLGIEDTDVASSIRGAIQRAPGDHGEGFDMLDAKLELSLGHEDIATQKLETLVREGGSLASEALATLMKAKLNAKEAIPEAMIADAIALSFTLQKTPLGATLAELSIAATIQNGESSLAFERIAQAQREEALAGDVIDRLLNDAYLSLAQNAEDIEFIRRSFAPSARKEMAKLSVAPRRAVAARLLDLGFASPAREILVAVQDIPEPEDRFLFARAALMQGRAQVAVGYLAGIDGVEAELLRARAFEAAKDETRAAEVFESLDKINEAARSAWRGGDYARVERIGSPQEQRVANLATSQPPEAALGLATNRALVEQSVAARKALNDLIRSLPNP
ncbi:MAG: hypothetical protein ACRBBK_05065 [Paracoccaceae bacterium]